METFFIKVGLLLLLVFIVTVLVFIENALDEFIRRYKMSNKVYDFLKWLCLIGIPTFTTFFVTLDSIFMWGYGDTVSKVSVAVCALIGGLIGISSAQYYKANGSLPMPEDEQEVDNNEVGEG